MVGYGEDGKKLKKNSKKRNVAGDNKKSSHNLARYK